MNTDNLNRLVGLAILAIAALFIWRRWTKKTELQTHMESERRLQDSGKVTAKIDMNALGNYPLATIGVEPFAGVHFDPFFILSPAAEPQKLQIGQGLPSTASNRVLKPLSEN